MKSRAISAGLSISWVDMNCLLAPWNLTLRRSVILCLRSRRSSRCLERLCVHIRPATLWVAHGLLCFREAPGLRGWQPLIHNRLWCLLALRLEEGLNVRQNLRGCFSVNKILQYYEMDARAPVAATEAAVPPGTTCGRICATVDSVSSFDDQRTTIAFLPAFST